MNEFIFTRKYTHHYYGFVITDMQRKKLVGNYS